MYKALVNAAVVSPSATFFVESTESAHSRPAVKEERLLAVGDPSFDRGSNPKLPRLPGAEREVERLASGYPRRRLLVGDKATRQSIIAEIPRVDVAHFAAHYEIDPRSSLS